MKKAEWKEYARQMEEEIGTLECELGAKYQEIDHLKEAITKSSNLYNKSIEIAENEIKRLNIVVNYLEIKSEYLETN